MVHTVRGLELGVLGGREVVGSFDGGDISTDGGVMVVAEAERRLCRANEWQVLVSAEGVLR